VAVCVVQFVSKGEEKSRGGQNLCFAATLGAGVAIRLLLVTAKAIDNGPAQEID
jgi:hypothetical protein